MDDLNGNVSDTDEIAVLLGKYIRTSKWNSNAFSVFIDAFVNNFKSLNQTMNNYSLKACTLG